MLRTRLPFYTVVALSVLVALASWRFLGLGIDLSFPGFDDHLEARRLIFVLHVSIAPIALAIGVFQFMPNLRAKRPAVHRLNGRAYAVCVLVSGLAGFWLALHAPGGMISGVGFAALAVLWVGFTAKAVWHAMHRQIAIHRDWMIRSFALTFAGVTLRLYLAGFMVSGTGYLDASPWLAWMCWVPNLIFAEWWIARSRRKSTT
jgi:hypothetical protein